MKKVLDVSKMKKSLSWEPTITLNEALKMTYKWYLESQKMNKSDWDDIKSKIVNLFS